MIKNILALLLFLGTLEAEHRHAFADPFVLAATEGEPHLNISDTVSPITGNFYLGRDDLVVQGIEPLHIPSLYISGDGRTEYLGKVGWEILPHQQLVLLICNQHQIKDVVVTEKNGSRLEFNHTIDNEYHIDLKRHGPGITNDGKGALSARTHLRNAYVLQKKDLKRMTYYAADGTRRRYKFCKDIKEDDYDTCRLFLLKWEHLPNGNWIQYKYDKYHRPKLIETTNHDGTKIYASARFTYQGKPDKNPSFSIETSDGQKIHYEFKADGYYGEYGKYVSVYVLNKITRNFGPSETFSYEPGKHENGPRMIEAALPDGHFIAPAYYSHYNNQIGNDSVVLKKSDCRWNRVKTLSSPVGCTSAPVVTHRFFYDKNKQKDNAYKLPCKTQVYDVYNNLTTILANPFCRPTETQWFKGQNELVRSEKTLWGEQDLEIGNIRAKIFVDPLGEGSFAKIYQYDAFGNIVSEKFCGNLSGQASPCGDLHRSSPAPSKEYKVYIYDRPNQDLLIGNKSKNFSTDWTKYLHRVGVGLYKDHFDENPQFLWRLISCTNDEATFRIEENSSPQISPSTPTEIAETTYGYTPNHLMAWKKEPSGLITRFTYRGDSDSLASRLTYDGEKILTREFFEYNSDHILIKTLQDDGSTPDPQDLTGVTQRKIKQITLKTSQPHQGFPEIIEEKDLHHQLLKKTVLTYNARGKITSQDIYDSQGQFRYRLATEYDGQGRVISQTNALGQTESYTYDAVGNKTMIRSGRLTTYHTYDFASRLIQTTIEGEDGLKQTTYHKYNLKNQKISTIDPHGHETRFSYDAFDNLLETNLPTSEVLKATYDAFGHQLSSTDGNGHTTTRTYNAKGKPTSIHHPDGTVETYLYNIDGTLKTHIDQQGTSIEHIYDVNGRLIQKEIVSSSGQTLSLESWTYGSYQLLSKTDAAGTVTTYEYDGAGRKIGEVCGQDRIEYTYDSLGRISKTRCGPRIQMQDYDLLDRVIEERTEDLEGNILLKTLYAYDSAGNKTEITHWTSTGPSTELTLYDSLNRPVQHLDPLGHVTVTTYDDALFQKTTTDPEGTRRIETYDILGRLSLLELKNPSNDLLHQEAYFYDGAGNKIRQETTVIIPRAPPKIITTLWEYGPLNRLLILTEAEGTLQQRTTRYAYTLKGLLQQIQKPDGTALKYTYDALNRLLELESSDLSCHYLFSYNALHQPILIEDLTQNTRTLRSYDQFSRLISETLGNGLSVHSAYDILGRKTALTLPDHSSITYTYDAAFLREISRNSPDLELLYTHRYTRFDPSGHLLEQELICNLGSQEFIIDPLGRTVGTYCPYFDATIASFDGRGNLQTVKQEGLTYQYTYDDLSQLTTENHHTYLYDSNHNRVAKNGKTSTFNSLNQIDLYTYDKNGNPLSDGKTHFAYDALDRLTAVITGTHYAQFTYDAFHRRITKKLFVRKNDAWVEESHLRYLYDGDNEIGSADRSGNLQEVRVLGLGKGAEIGASVAIELQNKIYAPLHDFRGNIIKLISKTGQIEESYTYTAFGEETVSNPLNPWRYSSKRTETEFNLVYFGRRFYAPHLGRWLTPDPQGFTDGMNLYAYVHNNPLLKLDLYGLEGHRL